MKKKFNLVVLTTTLLLASCTSNPTSNSDSNSTFESTSDSISTDSTSSLISDIPLTYDATYIYQTLSLIGKTSNYELVYQLNETQYRDIYTPNYVYYEYNQNGGILLDSYQGDGKIMYQYEINNQNVEVLSVLTDNQMNPLKNTEEFDFMPLINDPRYAISESCIEATRTGELFSDDKNLILILATVLGYYEYAVNDLFERVTFNIDKQGNITFTIQAYSMDGNYDLENIDSGRFENVNHAKNEVLENFVKDFKLSDNKLSTSHISDILNDNVSTHSEITLYYGDEISNIGSQDVDIKANYLNVASKDNQTNKTATQLYKNIDGKAHICGIDVFNKPTMQNSEILWDELNWPKNIMDMDAFRETSKDTYHYYGNYANALFYSLTYLTLDTVKSIDIKVKDGKVYEMNTIFSNSIDNINTVYHYSVKTTFVEQRNINEPQSYTVNQQENEKIAASFANFTSNHRYRVTAYDFEYKNPTRIVMSVIDNVVLYNITTSEGNLEYGYVEKNGTVIPFVVNLDKSLSVNGTCPANAKLDDYISFNLSSEVFTINEEGRYVPKNNLIGIEDHLFMAPNLDGIIVDSLSMIVNDNNQITRMVYNYSVQLANGQTLTGTDFIDIDQYGTAKLTNKMKAEIEKL